MSINLSSSKSLPSEKRYVLSSGDSLDLHLDVKEMCVVHISFEPIDPAFISAIRPSGQITLIYGDSK